MSGGARWALPRHLHVPSSNKLCAEPKPVAGGQQNCHLCDSVSYALRRVSVVCGSKIALCRCKRPWHKPAMAWSISTRRFSMACNRCSTDVVAEADVAPLAGSGDINDAELAGVRPGGEPRGPLSAAAAATAAVAAGVVVGVDGGNASWAVVGGVGGGGGGMGQGGCSPRPRAAK